jgi:hypothetical protein
MSNDLILTWIYFLGDKPHDERKRLLLEACEKITPRILETEFIGFLENFGSHEYEYDACIGLIKNVVTQFFYNIDSGNTEYIAFDFGTMYLTGGTSWGDDPSQEYSLMIQFIQLPNWFINVADISNTPPSVWDQFMKEYGKVLPEDVKDRLNALQSAMEL